MLTRASWRFGIRCGATLFVVTAVTAFAPLSRADEATLPVAGPAPEAVVSPSEALPASDELKPYGASRRPNLVMIGSGVVAFGLSYGISAIAGASSSHYGDSDYSCQSSVHGSTWRIVAAVASWGVRRAILSVAIK